jgi:hypothetical protein
MGMTPEVKMTPRRIVLLFVGLALAAVVPMTVSRFGVPIFWSQALGIIAGSFPLYMAVRKEKQTASQIVIPWLLGMSIATIVAFLSQKVCNSSGSLTRGAILYLYFR